MRNIIIAKEYKYLGEYPLFKENGLPVGYLIDKGKVGCGGTSIALENDKDTIICVPFISLIKNKMQKYNIDGKVNVLGVYEGVTTNEIKEYLSTKKGAKKIMCTYNKVEQLLVRCDDKLNRIKNRQNDEDEDPIKDLIGYLILILVCFNIEEK